MRPAAVSVAATTPITIASFFPGATSATATTVATTSITPVANRLYLVSVTSLTAVSVAPNPPTLSGNGISWVLYGASVFDDTGTSLARSTLFYGISASPTAGVLTADFGTQLQDTAIIVVDEASNVNVSSPVVQIAVNQNKTAATDLTVAMGAFASTSNATYATFSKEATAATATPTGGIANLAFFDVSGKITAQTAYLIGNTLTPGESWSVACQSSGIAIEIAAYVASAGLALNAATSESPDAGSGVLSTTADASSSGLEPVDAANGGITSTVALSGAPLELSDAAAGSVTQLASTALNGSALEGLDLSAGVVATSVTVNASPLELTDSASGSASTLVALSSAVVEPNDAAAGSATQMAAVSLNGAALETADLAVAAVGTLFSLNASALETADRANGSAATWVALSGAAAEDSDSAVGSATPLTSTGINASPLEASDAASGSMSAWVVLSAAVIELGDSAAGRVAGTIALTGNGLEGPDIARGSAGTGAVGGGGGGDTRKKKRILVEHEGQTLAFDSRRAAERAIRQLEANAAPVAQPMEVVAELAPRAVSLASAAPDTSAHLAAQRAIQQAQYEDEDDIEMLLLAL